MVILALPMLPMRLANVGDGALLQDAEAHALQTVQMWLSGLVGLLTFVRLINKAHKRRLGGS